MMVSVDKCFLYRPSRLRILDIIIVILLLLILIMTLLIQSYHYHLIVAVSLLSYNINNIITLYNIMLRLLIFITIIDSVLSLIWILSFILRLQENINKYNDKIDSNNIINKSSNNTSTSTSNDSIQMEKDSKTNYNYQITNNTNNNKNSNKTKGSNPVVIDIGSLYTRSGFAGDSKPSSILSSHEYWSGQSAMWKQGLCEGNHVRDSNKTTVSWDDIEKMFHTIYDEELSVPSSNQSLLLSWCPTFSDKDVETAAEMAFESLHVPAIYLGQVPVLSLYGNGYTTGISFHSGERLTHTCAIYEGYALSDTLNMSNRAGSAVTRKLARLLLDKKDKKIDLKALSESTWEALRINKNRLLKISNNKDSSNQSPVHNNNDDRTVLLPDGMLVKLAEEDRDLCGEQLFNDEKLSSKNHDSYDSSMQSLVISCIKSTENNIHKSLWENVILSGGNTKLNGFKERLYNELLPFSSSNKIDIKQKKNIDTSVWLGGSVIASNDNFNNHWITKEMYHEFGTDIINKHCSLIRKK